MADRVMIVEAERLVAIGVEERLLGMGFDVVGLALDGEGARSMALAQRPDVIVSNVRLQEGLDGIEAAARIREHLDVPFVFLTATADEETLTRVTLAESHACMIKPLDGRSFAVAIQMALQRHRAAQALADARRAQDRSDARYRAILENTHDAIISVDSECRVELFNKGAERVFGFAAAEVLGKQLDVILPEVVAHAHRAHFEAFRTSGTTFRPMGASREVVGRRRSGAEFPAEVTISRLRLDEKEIFTACVRDISDRRVLEEQFIRAQKMEAVGLVAASIAHDFNNLLTGLQASAYILRRGVPPEMQERVQEISSAVERGVALTRQVIGFSRQHHSHRARLVVNDLVGQAFRLLEHMIGSEVRLHAQLDPKAGHVVVEGNLIEQVLMNLVINARDALPNGGEIVVRTDAITLNADDSLPTGRYVRLAVTDSGGGIPSELHEKIFEPFFTTKAPGLGTGLGLFTVRTIARRSGGDVRLVSTPGSGCTFNVFLPQVDADAGTPQPNERMPLQRGSETILVVDDDPSVLRGVSLVLRSNGYHVVEARGCEQARAVVSAHGARIDLLLTDLSMPGCSGRELALQLVEQLPGLPVVFMTGFCETGEGPAPGFLDGHVLLQKPVLPDTLVRHLRQELDSSAEGAASRRRSLVG